jgi:cell division septum initiation protein DivIVA
MVDPIPDAPGLGPEDLTAAGFSKSKRGYDPVEVTALLGRGADALRAWQERDRRLQERITTLSAELDSALDIDEQRITEALGSETARIIAAARDAASSIRNRATAESAALLEEADAAAEETRQALEEELSAARAEAERLRTEATLETSELRREAEDFAERTRSSAQATHDELVAAAQAVLAERTAEAEAAAAAIRGTAEVERDAARADGERIREEALAAAEAERAQAMEAGRLIVEEVRQWREDQIERARRRHQDAIRQVEAVRAERDRIVSAIRGVGSTLDGTVGDLVGDDAGDDVLEPPPHVSIDDFVVQFPISAPVPATRPTAVATTEVADDPDEAAPPAPEALDDLPTDVTREEVVLDARIMEQVAADRSADVVVLDTSGDGRSAGAFGTPPDDEVVDQESSDAGTEDDGDEHGGHEHDIEVELQVVAGVDGDAGEVATVHDLFERVRAATDDESGDESGDESDEESDDGTDAPLEDPVALPSLLDRRDALLAPVEQALAKSLKRAVSDEQNEVLDRLRQARRTTPSIDELLGADDETDRYLDRIRSDSADAAAAGAAFWIAESGGDEVPDVSAAIDDAVAPGGLLHRLVAELLEHRRAHLVRVLDEADAEGLDPHDALSKVRGAYREWRSDRLAGAAGDLTSAGFACGVVAAAPVGATWCWVVDHGGLPCSDAEDNSLAGAVVAGEAFPTGDVAPPAHAGCRCILAPSPR